MKILQALPKKERTDDKHDFGRGTRGKRKCINFILKENENIKIHFNSDGCIALKPTSKCCKSDQRYEMAEYFLNALKSIEEI